MNSSSTLWNRSKYLYLRCIVVHLEAYLADQMPDGVVHWKRRDFQPNRYCQLALEKVMPLPVFQPVHEDALPMQDAILHTSGAHSSHSFHSRQLANERPCLELFDFGDASPCSCCLSALDVSLEEVFLFFWVLSLWVLSFSVDVRHCLTWPFSRMVPTQR